jgi:hypothetical protein
MDLQSLVGVGEAAAAIGAGVAWVRRECRAGRAGRLVAGRYLISPREIEILRRALRPRGRPKKIES